MKKILVFAVLALATSVAFAQETKEEAKHDKDVRECNEQGEIAGDEAVRRAALESPADAMRIKLAAKRFAVNACLRAKGITTPRSHEK